MSAAAGSMAMREGGRPLPILLPSTNSAMIETRASRLEALVGTHFKSVWRLLHHFGVPAATVEDATQEVFLVATARIDEIAPGSERAFLFGTALRVAQAQRRN